MPVISDALYMERILLRVGKWGVRLIRRDIEG